MRIASCGSYSQAGAHEEKADQAEHDHAREMTGPLYAARCPRDPFCPSRAV
jgi:hypothetical protein